MAATNKLSKRAVGFIVSGKKPKRAIIAKYPLAPPCPTEAYIKETTGRMSKNNQIYSISNKFMVIS